MPKCEREGWFKAIITDGGVSTTKESELPQVVASFLMQELYNATTEEFEDCSEYDETIDGYLVLVNKDGGDIFHCDNCKEVFGWDGQSFADLDTKLIKAVNEKKVVMIHVEENTYKDATNMQVQSIRREDSQPGGTIKKLDSSELKKLDAKFKRKAKPKAAAKPKAVKPVTPKKVTAPKKSAPSPEVKVAPGKCNKDDAWDFVCNEELWGKGIDQDAVDKAWKAAVEEMGPDEDQFTEDDWFVIREAITKQVFLF